MYLWCVPFVLFFFPPAQAEMQVRMLQPVMANRAAWERTLPSFRNARVGAVACRIGAKHFHEKYFQLHITQCFHRSQLDSDSFSHTVRDDVGTIG